MAQGVCLTRSSIYTALGPEFNSWLGEEELGRWLFVPASKREEIRVQFPKELQKDQITNYWLNTDPLASWRRFIMALDSMSETQLADSVRSNAESLSESSLTPGALFDITCVMKNPHYLFDVLDIPKSILTKLQYNSSIQTEEGLKYCINTLPEMSWARIAGVLWHLEETEALEATKEYFKPPTTADTTLNFHNLSAALDQLPAKAWYTAGFHLNIPKSRLREISRQFQTDEERKKEMMRVFLHEHPHPTWEYVSYTFYHMGGGAYHNVLERIRPFVTGGVPPIPYHVLKALQPLSDWLGEEGLGSFLHVPYSKREEIRVKFYNEGEQKEEITRYWLGNDPVASWRRLITALDSMYMTTVADSIRSYAEHLLEPSLTPAAVTSLMKKCHDGSTMFSALDVPKSMRKKFEENATEEEKMRCGIHYCLSTLPGISWARIAGVLWHLEEYAALDVVKSLYLPRQRDPTLNLENLCIALNQLPDKEWESAGFYLNIPERRLREISCQFQTDEERKKEMMRVFLHEHPHPTWEYVSYTFYHMGGGAYHNVLENIRSASHQGSSSEPSHDYIQLTIENLHDVRSVLQPVTHTWKSLGLALRLDHGQMKKIKKENSDDLDDCLTEMISLWLNKNYNTETFGEPSWELLSRAVGDPAGGNDSALAEKIKKLQNS